MLGKCNLSNVSEDDPHASCASGRPLDSPDSGLPPSPSAWPQPARTRPPTPGESGGAQEAGAATAFSPQFRPLSYGEGVKLDPLPPKELRYTSSICYDSDRHFITCVLLQPRGFGLHSCSQTVIALSQNTWRRYRTQLHLEPRQRAQRYQSTTILYPKHACAVYVTHLHYDYHRHSRRFFCTLELQPQQPARTEPDAPAAGH